MHLLVKPHPIAILESWSTLDGTQLHFIWNIAPYRLEHSSSIHVTTEIFIFYLSTT